MLAMNKRKALFMVKCIFACLLITYLIGSKKLDLNIIMSIRDTSTLFFLFGFLGVSEFIASHRFSYLVKSIGGELSTLRALRLNLIGMFFNNFLPGIVGGDIVKSYYFYRDISHKHVGMVFVDRFFGFIGLMFLAGISQMMIINKMELFYHHIWIIILWGTLLLLLISVVFLIFIIKDVRVKGYIVGKLIRFKAHKIILPIYEGLADLSLKKRQFYYLFLLSIIVNLASVIGIFMIAMALTKQSNIWTSFYLIPLTLLGGFIPITPGGIGWLEYLGYFIYSSFHMPFGAEIFLIWRIIAMIFSLMGLILYL